MIGSLIYVLYWLSTLNNILTKFLDNIVQQNKSKYQSIIILFRCYHSSRTDEHSNWSPRPNTYLIVTWVFPRELCLFFWREEAVGRHRLSMLLARLMHWSALLRFCTLAAFLRGEVDRLSALRKGIDLTICVLRGSISAKFTCRSINWTLFDSYDTNLPSTYITTLALRISSQLVSQRMNVVKYSSIGLLPGTELIK